MLNCMIVGLGGFLGSVCRYLIGLIPVREETAFPVKTFAINAAGAFLIGVIAGLTAKKRIRESEVRPLFESGDLRRFYHIFILRAGKL